MCTLTSTLLYLCVCGVSYLDCPLDSQVKSFCILTLTKWGVIME